MEIAIRALSAAVNDTFTALACIDWLGDGLCKIADRWRPATVHRDAAGHLCVITVTIGFDRLIDPAGEQVKVLGSARPGGNRQ